MIRIATLATPATLPFLDRIISLKQEFWDYPAASQRHWFNENVAQGDLHVIACDHDDAVIGYTRIALGDEVSSVAIIDTLCVRGSEQSRGIGSMVMRVANEAILDEGRTGLLSCGPVLAPFYVRCGWSRAELPSSRPDEVTMQFIRNAAAFPVMSRAR
jgi:predicted N-acetyltransferase YhbS